MMMDLMSRWFAPVYTANRYGRADFAWLWFILAVGAALRFWNLGYPSLHGDEDIMALAALGVLEHGAPILPSGMTYVRAPLHTYIIVASMSVFGNSEWAIRFPSAIVGSFCGLFAFFLGKRFLEPKLNLVFVAIITFLPAMIEISQTGRMYVFLVACLLIFGSLIFRWERNARPTTLLFAFLVWLLALQFQALSIFAAPLFLFPGLSRRSWKQLFQGAAALGLAYLIFSNASRITARFYPDDVERLSPDPEVALAPLDLLMAGNSWVVIAVAIILGLSVVALGMLGNKRQLATMPAILLLGIGVIACVFLHYHLGGIALLLGAVAWSRATGGNFSRPLLVFVLVAVLAAVQLVFLSDEFPGRRIVGALAGTPTLWPIMRFASFTPAGIGIYVAILALALLRFARGRPMPIHFLVFAMMVWAPLFAIGAIRALPAHRHLLGILPFFLLCLVAALQYLLGETRWGERMRQTPRVLVAACVGVVIVLVNPVAAWVEASNDYRTHPDHKGAAQFLKSRGLSPDDILIAEDSINQTYYLGTLDYRLQAEDVAYRHAVVIEGRLRGNYTGTPYIVNGAELEAVLDAPSSGQVYIIGNGQLEMRSPLRGSGIREVLESDRLELIYEGRDEGRTKVWRRVQ